jgi:hypothetical protein
VVYASEQTDLLYNLRKDPGERRTLRGEEAALFTQIERELETWIKAC